MCVWICVCTLPAVHCDGVVARLLLLFLHRSNYINHAFTVSGDAHLRPAVEMELTHRSSLVLLHRLTRTKSEYEDMLAILQISKCCCWCMISIRNVNC